MDLYPALTYTNTDQVSGSPLLIEWHNCFQGKLLSGFEGSRHIYILRERQLCSKLDYTDFKPQLRRQLTPILLHVSPHFPLLRTMSKGTVPDILTFFPRSNMIAQLYKKKYMNRL